MAQGLNDGSGVEPMVPAPVLNACGFYLAITPGTMQHSIYLARPLVAVAILSRLEVTESTEENVCIQSRNRFP